MYLVTPLNKLDLTDTQELLYPYTGPAPLAFGTQTKYVLENIRRPYQYYKNLDTQIKTGERTLHDIHYDKPSSGFSPGETVYMARAAAGSIKAEIKNQKSRINKVIYNSPYSSLAQGRQTLSFISMTNIPASAALKETVDFLSLNLGERVGATLFDYNNAVLKVMEMDHIKMTRRSKDGIEYQVQITKEDFWDRIVTLNTMLKSQERGRKDRRSIATATMLVRGFVKQTEDVSRLLLEVIPYSGLPVGGIEKLAKLASILTHNTSQFTGELSGDEEKWNECLDPDCMRVILKEYLRDILSKEEIQFLTLSLCFFKGKLARLGPGLSVKNSQGLHKHIPVITSGTYSEVWPLIEGDRIRCRLGMFMGMFNFTSTIVAMCVIDYLQLKVVQSSDDFIAVFEADTKERVMGMAEKLRLHYKLVGINISPSKSQLIIPGGIGEFTSQYHSGDFVGNVSTELPALTPIGKNPEVDYSMGTKTIQSALSTQRLLHPTACLMLRIFHKNYQYIYGVFGTVRTNYLKSCQKTCAYQGGKLSHSVTSLHLNEYALKLKLKQLTEDQLAIILNPENPFGNSVEALTVRVESRMPVRMESHSTGSIFSYRFTRNRTVVQNNQQHLLEDEKFYRQVTKLIEEHYPTVLLGETRIAGNVTQAIEDRLLSSIAVSGLSDKEKEELETLLRSDQEVPSDSDSDDD